MEGLEDPSVSEFLKHPSYHQVATFFLGFVFVSCIHFTFHVPVAVARRLRQLVVGRRPTHGGTGLEANRPAEDDKVHGWLGSSNRSVAATSSSMPALPKSHNLALSLTVCFAMASLANFGSLLVFDPDSGPAGCAFLVAWGGMAAQSARLLGLLKLSLDLKKLGVSRWETFAFWGCLAVTLVVMFASNAISIGTIRPLPGREHWALCYRKHFLPTAVAASALNVVLEVYSLVRIFFLIVPAFLAPRHKLDGLLDVRMSRALSLLILELATAVPAAHFFSILADFIPGSLGALIVLAAFNQRSPDVTLASTASIPGTRPESSHSHSTIEIKKMPSTRSLTDVRERVSHPFAARALQDPSPETEDWPESASPKEVEKPYMAFPDVAAPTPPPPGHTTRQMRGLSEVSESDSDVARSVKGAVVGFAFKDVVGAPGRRQQRERGAPERILLPLPPARAEILPRTTPLRIPRPVLPAQALHVEALERASRYARDVPASSGVPSLASLASLTPPPPIAVTPASRSTSTDSSKPSITISVPSNKSSHGSNDSTKSSLHLTPSTPAPSSQQPSRRASSESDWRYDVRADESVGHGSSDSAASSIQLQRHSGASSRMPPADDDLSIVYEASHEDSDSVPPSRAHRPTFGEHMFVEGGIGRPISTPVGVPEDVGEGGHSNGSPSSHDSKAGGG